MLLLVNKASGVVRCRRSSLNPERPGIDVGIRLSLSCCRHDGTIMLDAKKSREFIEDVEAGISDAALRAKWHLTQDKLAVAKATAMQLIAQKRGEEAQPKRKVSAGKILSDCEAGLTNDELMTKYGLTGRQLQSVFRQLIEADLATPMELSGRLSMTSSQVLETFQQLGKAISEIEPD